MSEIAVGLLFDLVEPFKPTPNYGVILMEIFAGLLAWLVVGFVCIVVIHAASPIRQASIPYWKWYHFVLAVVLWPWLLIEIIIANFMGYFK